MSELKPCPFCGESKLLYSGGCGFRYDDDDNQIRLFRVHCRTCKGRTGVFESLDEAVEAWNRRTNSTTIQPSEHGTNLAEVGTDCISRQQAIDALKKDMASLDRIIKGMSANDVRLDAYVSQRNQVNYDIYTINNLPTAQPKRGKWILDRSGTYCCSECMEPCAGYVMMRPRDRFCKMCGAKMEGEDE